MSASIGDGQGAGDGASVGASSEVAPSDGGVVAGQGSDGASSGSAAVENGGQASSNWKPLLEAVPEQFHPVAKPILEKWDKSYNEMAQAYAPFKKQFVEQGISNDTLSSAYQLYDLVSKNPQEVFRRLAGALQQQGVKVNELMPGFVAQAEPQEAQEGQQGEQEEIDPKLKELQDKIAAQQQWIDQFQNTQQQASYEQQVKAAEQQLNSELKKIQEADPNANIPDILNRYTAQLSIADQAAQAGQKVAEPSIARAYQEQQAFIQSIRVGNPTSTTTAPPKVMPSGGSGIPGNTTQAKPESSDDRARKIEAMIMAANQ